ncbi:MAG: polyphenol oxidase family protein [Candidatus Saccharimonas sp.]
MIASDQPNCFPPELLVAVSSRSDGTMLDHSLSDRHDVSVVANRRAFCALAGGKYESSVYQVILYGSDQSYDTIAEVDRPDTTGVCADALYTETPRLGLILPVADCVATVVYDPVRRAVGLAHLGRHASVTKLIKKLLEFMIEKGSDPGALIVWMAPSVGRKSYRMEYFAHVDDPDWAGFVDRRDDGVYLDLAGFNTHLAQTTGVLSENIYRSHIDTARDPNYFSHSQGDVAGRFAVLVALPSAE